MHAYGFVKENKRKERRKRGKEGGREGGRTWEGSVRFE